MSQGTKEMRMAAMLVRDNLIHKIAEKENIIRRVDEDPKNNMEEWIYISWLIELQQLRNCVEDLEKQIVENEFDF